MVVATIAPNAASATHKVPLLASCMAFGAGVIWSLGSLTARLAKHADGARGGGEEPELPDSPEPAEDTDLMAALTASLDGR